MTIQMREGWVLLRNGKVDYAEQNIIGAFTETHPWRLKRSFESLRSDGRASIVNQDDDFNEDVIELLDPWDARVPEEHREKRFVVGTYGGKVNYCVFDRATGMGTFNYPSKAQPVALCEWLNANQDAIRDWAWHRWNMLSIDGKPCNPDGSLIPADNLSAKKEDGMVKPNEPFETKFPARYVTRTLKINDWHVVGRKEDGFPATITVTNAKSVEEKISLDHARGLIAAIETVCKELDSYE